MEKMENKNIVDDKDMFCYQHESFYVFSLPKIASSWLYQFFKKLNGYDSSSELFDACTVSINENSLTLSVNENDNITSFIPKDILNDWNSEKMGVSSNKDFIFLMRNPIDKYFGGVMQDVILPFLNLDSPDNIKILNTYPDKNILNKFLEYHAEQTKIQDSWYLYLNDKPNYTHIVMRYLIDYYVDNFFLNSESINQYRDGHKTSTLFLYYKLLFNSKFNKNSIKVVDIDFEDINSLLTSKYKLSVSLPESINKTESVFKNTIERSIARYVSYISNLIETDILLYCDILNKIYNVNLIPNELWNSKFEKLNEK